jgi:hypothetical protein
MAGFVVELQNQGQVSRFILKTKVNGFSIWASKSATLVC